MAVSEQHAPPAPEPHPNDSDSSPAQMPSAAVGDQALDVQVTDYKGQISASIRHFADTVLTRVLSHLEHCQLRDISHLCRLFHTTYLAAQAREERLIRCNFLNLPAEIWTLQILWRMNYDDVKKMESICTTFRDLIHNDRLLKASLLRGQVDNKSLLKHYQELEKVAHEGKDQHDETALDRCFDISLHPAFNTKRLRYHISRTKDNVTSATFKVFGFGQDNEGVKHLKKETEFLLDEHQIGDEAACEPAVNWFRFDFEDAGKQHRGTSDRYPTSNGKPRAVTVADVLKKLVDLKGSKKLARWYNGGRQHVYSNILWKESTFSPSEHIQANLIKRGNSIGIEFKKAQLICIESRSETPIRYPSDEDDFYDFYRGFGGYSRVRCWGCGRRGHKRYQCFYI